MTGSPDFLSIVRTQRAHRAFTAEPVPDELAEKVLEAATYAPSAENTQPWVFIVVRDDAARGRIGELNRQAWEGGGRDFSRPRLSPEVFAKVEAGVPGYSMITPYENVTGGDPRFMHFYEMDTEDPERAFRTMTPLVSERIGRPGTAEWDGWANTPELRIMYVNTFRRLGERSA